MHPLGGAALRGMSKQSLLGAPYSAENMVGTGGIASSKALIGLAIFKGLVWKFNEA